MSIYNPPNWISANRSNSTNVVGAHCLGWASLAIGTCELLAPGYVEKSIGLTPHPENRGILRVLGVRELMHGAAILLETKPSPRLESAVASRIAGDVLDGTLLAAAAMKTRRPSNFAMVAGAVALIGTLDLLMSLKFRRSAASTSNETSGTGGHIRRGLLGDGDGARNSATKADHGAVFCRTIPESLGR